MTDPKNPQPLKPGYMERDRKEKEKERALVTYDQDRLKKNTGLGISGVDPADVMPSPVKLVQGNTDFSRVVDDEGKQAQVGQWFFQGDKTIHETVKGYVLSLSKINDPFNPRDDGSYERMYRMIGVFDDLKTPFSLNFRRGAITTVKNLLGNVFNQKRGVYTFLIEITTEQKKGAKGNYLVPIITILENVTDPKMLNLLERGAMKYESLIHMMGDEDLTVVKPKQALPETTEPPVDPDEKLPENVNPDDIPF